MIKCLKNVKKCLIGLFTHIHFFVSQISKTFEFSYFCKTETFKVIFKHCVYSSWGMAKEKEHNSAAIAQL